MIEAMGALFIFGGAGLMIVAMTYWRGFALSTIWGWFAVPIFHLSPLSIPQALGVSLLVGLFTYHHVPSKDGETWQPIAYGFMVPLFALGIGWIIKSYFI